MKRKIMKRILGKVKFVCFTQDFILIAKLLSALTVPQ